MPEIYYVKRGRRYERIGEQFTGFPADGLWLVINGDGRKSERFVIPLADLPSRPDWLRRAQLELLKDECARVAQRLEVRDGNRTTYPSLFDVISAVFDVICEATRGQKASRKQG